MTRDLADMSLEELIALAIEEKEGNKEFILSYCGGEKPEWLAGIGNPRGVVALGEAEPEICAPKWPAPYFPTAKEALVGLVTEIRKVQA